MRTAVTLLAAGLLLAGCSSPDDSRSAAAPTPTASAATLTPTRSPTPSPEPTCSAAQAPEAAGQEQGRLPARVAQTRQRILQAARACDYDELEQIALDGDGEFTYSFGGDGAPGRFWRLQEEQGEEPLRRLVGLLDLPHRYLDQHDQYIWPAAFAFDQWAQVPEQDREDLRSLYSEQELEQFAMFGAYIGHRVGIAPDGRWLFYVAGD